MHVLTLMNYYQCLYTSRTNTNKDQVLLFLNCAQKTRRSGLQYVH